MATLEKCKKKGTVKAKSVPSTSSSLVAPPPESTLALQMPTAAQSTTQGKPSVASSAKPEEATVKAGVDKWDGEGLAAQGKTEAQDPTVDSVLVDRSSGPELKFVEKQQIIPSAAPISPIVQSSSSSLPVLAEPGKTDAEDHLSLFKPKMKLFVPEEEVDDVLLLDMVEKLDESEASCFPRTTRTTLDGGLAADSPSSSRSAVTDIPESNFPQTSETKESVDVKVPEKIKTKETNKKRKPLHSVIAVDTEVGVVNHVSPAIREAAAANLLRQDRNKAASALEKAALVAMGAVVIAFGVVVTGALLSGPYPIAGEVALVAAYFIGALITILVICGLIVSICSISRRS